MSDLIDSIELQNLYAHDTVKIKNYIYLHEKINQEFPDTSLFFINNALKIDSVNPSHYIAYLLLYKAQLLHDMHKYSQAMQIYNKALETVSKNKQKTLTAQIYHSLGILYIDLNMFEEAFYTLTDALRLININRNSKLYSDISNTFGYAYHLQKQYKKALDFYNQSFKIYKSMNDKAGMATCYNNIGGMYFYLGYLDSVLIYFNKALNIYKELNNTRDQAFPIYNIGETYYEMNQYDIAIKYILKAFEIDKEYQDKAGMAKSLNFLGKIYSAKGHYNYALVLYDQAKEISNDIEDIFELKDIYFNISLNYEKLRSYDKALEYYKLHSQIKDSIYDVETSKQILEVETKYQTEQQLTRIQMQQYELLSQQNEIKQQWLQKIAILCGFVILFIIFLFIFRNYRLKNKSNELLLKQKEQIQQQNHKITSSIQYAKLIQTAALPPHDLLKSIFSQHFVLFLPRDIVSGDFFWATRKDNNFVLACADCTGHGVPGAFMSMLGVSFLTEIVNRTEKLKADNILEDLRQNIIESLHQTGKIGESRDGMDIALCIINEERSQLEYAGAFIPFVIIRDNNIIQISADKMPIGVHDDTLSPFTSHKVKLMKGDMVYLFTDGYADQFGGPFNKKFKMQPFLSLLLAQHGKPLVQQREILYDTIMTWKGEQEQVDDILVMGFRV